MRRGTPWPLVFTLAVLASWVAPVSGDPPADADPESTLLPIAAPPPVAPTSGAAALPSTVSPSIALFLKQSGRDGPATTAPNPTPRGRRPVRLPTPVGRPGDLVSSVRPPVPTTPPFSVPVGVFTPALGATIKAAPLEPTDVRMPINLATALRLTDARPLMVAAAQARVWVAEAQLLRAKVLWVPTAMFGLDYLRHDGGGPDFNKGIITAPSVNYAIGGAALNMSINVTDALFEPLAARQTLSARHWDTQAAKNDALLRTADAYFRVHQYRGMYAGAIYTVEKGQDLVKRIKALSNDLVPADEVDRARNFLADLEQRATSARQEWRTASADLTEVLRLDPRAVVIPTEHDHSQITMIDPGRSLDDLMPIALVNRPELSSREATLEAARVRIRQEKMRPVLPTVMLNGFQTPQMDLQAGLFALGPNSSLNQFRGRDDVSFQLIWQLENLGFGNLGRIKKRRGNESQAIIDLRKAQDMVVADVNRAQAQVQSAAARVLQADHALRTGIAAFNGHLEGLSETRRLGNVLVLTFRPQEAVYSLDLLNVAFNEYFTTVADYNRAQFALFHAIGFPAAEIAKCRLPGEVRPVDVSRPDYLPPVGNGPPPASR